MPLKRRDARGRVEMPDSLCEPGRAASDASYAAMQWEGRRRSMGWGLTFEESGIS